MNQATAINYAKTIDALCVMDCNQSFTPQDVANDLKIDVSQGVGAVFTCLKSVGLLNVDANGKCRVNEETLKFKNVIYSGRVKLIRLLRHRRDVKVRHRTESFLYNPWSDPKIESALRSLGFKVEHLIQYSERYLKSFKHRRRRSKSGSGQHHLHELVRHELSRSSSLEKQIDDEAFEKVYNSKRLELLQKAQLKYQNMSIDELDALKKLRES